MTSIEWTDRTWNPIVGCSRVSRGCENCYAERFAHRKIRPEHRGLTLLGKKGPRWNGKVRLVGDRLGAPITWKKSKRIFVNSMSDLFHETLSFEQIASVFGVMAAARWHTFQVLTKRLARAAEFFAWVATASAETRMNGAHGDSPAEVCRGAAIPRFRALDGSMPEGPGRRLLGYDDRWPLPNVEILASIEDQDTADRRIPILLTLPAAVRGVSLEPALGPVDLGLSSATCDCCRPRWSSRWVRLHRTVASECTPEMIAAPGVYRATSNRHGALCVETKDGRLGIKPDEFTPLPALDWVIVGGESGPRARAFDVAWARSAVAQCRVAHVPVFVKQLGAVPVSSDDADLCGRQGALHDLRADAPSAFRMRITHRKGSDMGEWPDDLRVRELPTRGPA